jgi:1-acyl-sn-glycerol-3-phosphate acyltransferase
MILPIAARIRIVGKENFPKEGPLIIVGNHTAVMEPVLVAVYCPKQVEFIGSIDVPHEPSTRAAMDFYRMIPVFRGKPERKSLKQSLEVLAQKGLIVIFPEGGLWSPGQMQAKSGVSFLSHRSGAPVLPLAFIGAEGALNAIFRGKRPEITMIVGELIPSFTENPALTLKQAYESYAADVMRQVFSLLPTDVLANMNDIVREEFVLEVNAVHATGSSVEIPEDAVIQYGQALAMLLHRPAILKIFKVNLKMPVGPLQRLHENPTNEQLRIALRSVIDYLRDEEHGNPYLLTYRFGNEAGQAMLDGLVALSNLVDWCSLHDLQVRIKPIRKFYSQSRGMTLEQVEQGEFNHWR